MKIDLHMHSIHSDDGELLVEEIINLAKTNNTSKIAITDHNSVKGVARAIEYGEKKGIKVISGVELDCTYNGLNLHLLGYGFDSSLPIFDEIHDDVFTQEIANSEEKIRLLKSATDFEIDRDKIMRLANGQIVTGELIGEVILEEKSNHKNRLLQPYLPGGEKDDMPFVHFYWDFFAQGKVAYTPMKFLDFTSAIKIIKDAGGVAVLAHPGNNLKSNKNLIHELIKAGIDGIEVYSTYHKDEDTEFFKKVAEENSLLVTCGTDFHGKNKPNIKLGDFRQKIDFEKIAHELESKIENRRK